MRCSAEQPAPETPGLFSWNRGAHAGDREADFAFYSALFGWTKAEAIDMGPAGIYQLFAHNGVAIGGMMTKPDSMPMPFWTYYTNVTSVDATIEKTKANGGEICNGPMQVPGGSWIVQARDPQGAAFNFVGQRGWIAALRRFHCSRIAPDRERAR